MAQKILVIGGSPESCDETKMQSEKLGKMGCNVSVYTSKECDIKTHLHFVKRTLCLKDIALILNESKAYDKVIICNDLGDDQDTKTAVQKIIKDATVKCEFSS